MLRHHLYISGSRELPPRHDDDWWWLFNGISFQILTLFGPGCLDVHATYENPRSRPATEMNKMEPVWGTTFKGHLDVWIEEGWGRAAECQLYFNTREKVPRFPSIQIHERFPNIGEFQSGEMAGEVAQVYFKSILEPWDSQPVRHHKEGLGGTIWDQQIYRESGTKFEGEWRYV